MHLGSLIEDLGSFGRYQRCIVCVLALCKALTVPPMITMAFAGVEPDWWCESRDQDDAAIFTNGSYQNCQWNETCQRLFESETVTIVSQWNLVCGKRWVSNTIISIQLVGVLFGSIIAGYCSDRYGRKKVVYGGLVLSTISNLTASFSVSWIMFAVIRVIIGLAVGLTLSCSFLYQLEFVGKKWRGVCATIPSWSLGVVLFAVLCWTIRNWKWLQLTIAALNIPLLLTWFVIPESLRWLAVKGRLEEARRGANRIAKYNKKTVPDLAFLELIAEEEKAEEVKAKSYSYMDLIRTRELRSRTLITCFIWLSVSIVYYAISFGVKNLSGDFYLNLMIMGLLEVPMALVHLFMVSINLAVAGQNTVARIGGILAAQIFSLGSKDDLMPPFVAMGILMSFTALSCFGLEETSKTALEDTMKKYTREISKEDAEEILLRGIPVIMNGTVGAKGDNPSKAEEDDITSIQCGDDDKGSICQPRVEITVELIDNSAPQKDEGNEQRRSSAFLKLELDT